MAHNFTEAVSYTAVKNATNMRILNRALINSHYRYYMPASVFTQVGTAAQWIQSDLTIPPHWLFPTANPDQLACYVARPQEWRNGVVGVILHWNSPNPAATVQFDIGVHPMAQYGTPAAANTSTFSLTTNAIADLMEITPLYGQELATFTQVRAGVTGFHVVIHGHHLNADVRLFGVELVYLERGTAAGGNN